MGRNESPHPLHLSGPSQALLDGSLNDDLRHAAGDDIKLDQLVPDILDDPADILVPLLWIEIRAARVGKMTGIAGTGD